MVISNPVNLIMKTTEVKSTAAFFSRLKYLGNDDNTIAMVTDFYLYGYWILNVENRASKNKP